MIVLHLIKENEMSTKFYSDYEESGIRYDGSSYDYQPGDKLLIRLQDGSTTTAKFDSVADRKYGGLYVWINDSEDLITISQRQIVKKLT